MNKITLILLVIALLLFSSPLELPVYAQDIISITLIDAGDPGIIFGEVDPGSEDSGDVAQSESMPAVGVWVGSETAVSVNISIRGTTTGALTLSEWEYSTNITSTKYPLNSTYEVVYSGVSSNNTYDFYHWVDVPVSIPAGSYYCTVEYKAVTLP